MSGIYRNRSRCRAARWITADASGTSPGRHLARVQERRDASAHGDPKATDGVLTHAVVETLKREHESWIAASNRRGAFA
jgi:hypothetical protein